MPNKDGTGPNGKGPLTGRKMGNCQGDKPTQGGCGMGRGKRGMRQNLDIKKDKDA